MLGWHRAHLPASRLACFPVPLLPNRTCTLSTHPALDKVPFRIAFYCIEHRLDSLHFAIIYECIHHRPPRFSGGYRAGLPDNHTSPASLVSGLRSKCPQSLARDLVLVPFQCRQRRAVLAHYSLLVLGFRTRLYRLVHWRMGISLLQSGIFQKASEFVWFPCSLGRSIQIPFG